MSAPPPLTIAIIAGEESGDLLAADLVRALALAGGREIRLVGIGGPHLAALGLRSFYDPQFIAIVGIGGVLTQVPQLARRLSHAAARIAAARPDCLITVDVPDFSLRVAARVRKAAPSLPVVHYVCPSVWAWRPGRAKAMKAFVDHVLCILPFEPEALRRLEGPPGSFVGHRLTHEPGLAAAAAERKQGSAAGARAEKTLLLLPGSRRGEVARLIGDFRETVEFLRKRGHDMRLLLPTVPAVRAMIEAETADWANKPLLTVDPSEKWRAFAQADAALIASGTVSLELALAGVPHLSTYRLDTVGRLLVKNLVRSWSASLPNLIADRPLISEFFHDAIKPPVMARHIEALWSDTELRRWQIEGFAAVAAAMRTDCPAGRAAAGIVLEVMARRGAR